MLEWSRWRRREVVSLKRRSLLNQHLSGKFHLVLHASEHLNACADLKGEETVS